MSEDLVTRLRKRAEIRRQITTRKSVQNNEPDRIADLLEESADRIAELEKALTKYRIQNFTEDEYGQTITLAELRKTDLYHNVRKQLTKPAPQYKDLSDKEIASIYKNILNWDVKIGGKKLLIK